MVEMFFFRQNLRPWEGSDQMSAFWSMFWCKPFRFQIKFVKDSELNLEHRQAGRGGFDFRSQESRIASIISSFNSKWKSSLDTLV